MCGRGRVHLGGRGREGRGRGPPDPLTPQPEHCWVLKAALSRSHRPAPRTAGKGALASGPEQTEAGGQVTAAPISSPSGS